MYNICRGCKHVPQSQQITVGAPAHAGGDSFTENIGVGFGFNIPGSNMSFNNGFNPNSGATLGFGFGGKGVNGSVNVGASQSGDRSLSMSAGTITLENGAVGSITDATYRPFVTSIVPVVGSGGANLPIANTAIDERLSRIGQVGGNVSAASGTRSGSAGSTSPQVKNSTAGSSAAALQTPAEQNSPQSIAEIRRQQSEQAAAAQNEVEKLLGQGRAAQAAGKSGVAKIYFQQALHKASGPSKEQALAALRSLDAK